jgi:hypothetical protein
MNLKDYTRVEVYCFTIDCLDWPVDVHYNIFPAEPRSWETPGTPREIEVTQVMSKGVNVMDALPEKLLDDIRKYFGDGRER